MNTHPTPPKIVQCPIDGVYALTKGKNYQVIWTDEIWDNQIGYGFRIIDDRGDEIFCVEKHCMFLGFNDWLIIEREPAEPVKPESNQTAAEWLIKRLPEAWKRLHKGDLQQAKQIEREQIETAFRAGYLEAANSGTSKFGKTGTEYYEQTYLTSTASTSTDPQ